MCLCVCVTASSVPPYLKIHPKWFISSTLTLCCLHSSDLWNIYKHRNTSDIFSCWLAENYDFWNLFAPPMFARSRSQPLKIMLHAEQVNLTSFFLVKLQRFWKPWTCCILFPHGDDYQRSKPPSSKRECNAFLCLLSLSLHLTPSTLSF